MRRTGLGSGVATPSDAVPCLHQLPENGSEVFVSKETWDVLQERESRSNLTDDADCLGPHISVVVNSKPLPGDRERLAREATSDDIHEATPRSTVEGSDVVPDREHGEHAVPLAPQQDFSAVRLDFHGADGLEPEEMGAEESPTSSGKK